MQSVNSLDYINLKVYTLYIPTFNGQDGISLNPSVKGEAEDYKDLCYLQKTFDNYGCH